MENINNNQGFSFDLPKGNSSIIKVIGVGGGGNNALKHMYEKGILGVDFVICNTDSQTLDNNPVANKVQLGTSTTEGLGAGADPEVGEKAAIESIDDIKAAMGQNTKMVFITAGMGGGTGTGAAPVIAKVAKEMGILTVGIVTVPFSFEGRRRLDQAEQGLEKLRNNVDSLIVINNDKLRQQFGNLGFKTGFLKADEVLTNAAKGMAEVITGYFDINIDFRDAKSVLQNSGTALMSTGAAQGENRAEEAVKKALDSPLLNDNKITGAKDVLLLIRSGNEEATMDEIGLINDYIQREAGNTAEIIFGVGSDEELGESISVLVIATGFSNDNIKHSGTTETIKYNLLEDRESSLPKRTDSPFKTRAEKDAEDGVSTGRNVFRLEDDEDFSTPNFPTNTFAGTAVEEVPQEVKFFEKEESESFNQNWEQSEAPQDFNLFNYDEEEEFSPIEDLEAEAFTFEIENKINNQHSIQVNNEEKPVEINFVINEPIQNEEMFVHQEEEAEPIINKVEKVEVVQEIVAIEEELKIEVPQPEMLYNFEEPKAAEKPFVEEQEDEFTFINKTAESNKILERRNKLKEFNSRYQKFDYAEEFESIPAFKRKNIDIDGNNASDNSINNFLSDNNGRVQLRENKFLNKDVD
ncbi:cell division protein FtsZ [Chryseobacterium sp. POL2]|uniref:cell division protein FtsZ n=1 Tax=Chryseobacterium sp. POL2 TaxID=2713414 RepID=UPI0013E126E2|nr:cell division protein FtsZ [Chryseobacterium sp. POL2]QIG89969.1 cell division protein FtsZ [Chryseobacterium sp. POL2]